MAIRRGGPTRPVIEIGSRVDPRYELTDEERAWFLRRSREIEAEHPDWHWTRANHETWRELRGEGI